MPDVGATPVGVTSRGRYTLTAQALHWLTAVFMFTAIPLAWVMVNMPRTAPDREWIYTLHKSFGLLVLALVAARLAWRAFNPAPPLPAGMQASERASAFASHWLLYLVMIGMPVSGYLLSAASGRNAVPFFDLFTLPNLPANPPLSEAARYAHVAVGQWLVYGLIVLHLAATAWHVAVRRDGVLGRMLPEQQ